MILVNFWEDDEPEQSEAIIIEEAVEVPEYAIPEQNFGNDLFSATKFFSKYSYAALL